MKTRRRSPSILRSAMHCSFVASALALSLSATASAQTQKKNIGGKIYISEINGEATIGIGDKFEDVNKRSVYNAQGAVIETTPPQKDGAKPSLTLVYSNGTAAFLGADTRIEIKRFTQEPFVPNRSDVEVEPSVSQTQVFMARGTIALSTSKPVPGSSTVYQTPHGSVNIRGQKVVIETGANGMKVSVLQGESTIRGGTADVGAYTVRAGEQAIVQANASTVSAEVLIAPLASAESQKLNDSIVLAYQAKRTVYFEERVRKATSAEAIAGATSDATDESAGAADEPAGAGTVSAFDSTTTGTTSTSGRTVRELVPVELVPIKLPTEYTISTSVLQKP